jgi:L-threonylcarbamoyladenylate synthase
MNIKTTLLPLDHPTAFNRAAAVIEAGGVIAFPTDTVYGIGVSPFDKKALEKIYLVKGRSHLKAIPILIADVEDLDLITPQLSPAGDRLINKFWPGALTLILPLLPDLPKNLSPTPTVGLRIPDHAVVRDLLRQTGPLATTSANLSGEPSALTGEGVLQQLDGRIDLVLNGGPAPGGTASTVLDCSRENPVILREGPISWEKIAAIISAS